LPASSYVTAQQLAAHSVTARRPGPDGKLVPVEKTIEAKK
jgi:hypothetical protein